MNYPKIQTLWNRDKETFKVIPGEYRMAEFALPKKWVVTEKIHGTNIRVILKEDGAVTFGGRTENAQIPTFLLEKLQEMFPPKLVRSAFEPGSPVTLYGEGYGARIQKGGGNYNPNPAFRLFDVRVGDWWLNWEDVEDVAQKLSILTVPTLDYDYDILPTCAAELADLFEMGNLRSSFVAYFEGIKGHNPEGIVARTNPLLFTRQGKRVMWKLKFKDFT